MGKLTIAIDGHASTGKSSIAKKLAKSLGYLYINSGSMYRAVTLYAIENNLLELIDLDINKFIKKLKENKIYFKKNENKSISEIYLNKKNIENEIKSLRVSQKVSLIAAVPEIRKEMVKLQRNIDRTKGVVMDGRDIGSVVFPDADIKLFLTASPDIRAKRRHNEMINDGEIVNIKDVLENILVRDNLDTTRKDSPLVIEKDAIVIDNSYLSIEDQLAKILALINQKIKL
jgi:cytidylate kinase|tara:strand:- start:441 stop:1130 length:690 start_codon:yes stop_codon:yes gene_type:complete